MTISNSQDLSRDYVNKTEKRIKVSKYNKSLRGTELYSTIGQQLEQKETAT